MPAVNSGRSVIDSPPRSSNEYISFETTSVVSPIVRANTCGLLDGRHLDALEPVQAAHAVERRDHRGEAVGVFSEQALRAPDGLNRRHCRALKHKIRASGISASASPAGCRSRWNCRRIGAGDGRNSFLKLIMIVRPSGSSRSGW